MRLHPGCLLSCVALLTLPLGGCQYLVGGAALGAAVGVATTPPPPAPGTAEWPPGTALSVDFAAPRELVATLPGARDSVRVRGVTRVVGRVQDWHGDTLLLSLTQVRRAAGSPLAFGRRSEPTTRLTRDPAARVQPITLQSATSRGLLGAGTGVVLGVIGIFVHCRIKPCLS